MQENSNALTAIKRRRAAMSRLCRVTASDRRDAQLERLKSPGIEASQRERWLNCAMRRDSPAWPNCWRISRRQPRNRKLMPVFSNARNDVTLGEICGVLRRLWGSTLTSIS